jgi:hypothetical protein
MAVFLDKDGFIPALEQMAGSPMPFVEDLGIDAVQLPHPDREIAIWRFNEEMIVVGHEAVSVANPIVTIINMPVSSQEVLAVCVVLEDGLLLVPS